MAEPATNTRRVRAERLEARVTADQKNLIEHAAALQGRSVKPPGGRLKSISASISLSETARRSWKP